MTSLLLWIALVVPMAVAAPVPDDTAEALPADDLPAEDRGEEADEPGPDADLEAVEPPKTGIWEWVDKLEGEIPTDEQLAAMKEAEDERRSSDALLQVLADSDLPALMYTDPAKALYVDPLFLDQVDPKDFDIPIEVNGSVAKWVTYFTTGSGREYYKRWMRRSTRYRPMMYAKLEAAGMPRDLVYLSMIESGYNAHAYSHAHAAGLVQRQPEAERDAGAGIRGLELNLRGAQVAA